MKAGVPITASISKVWHNSLALKLDPCFVFAGSSVAGRSYGSYGGGEFSGHGS